MQEVGWEGDARNTGAEWVLCKERYAELILPPVQQMKSLPGDADGLGFFGHTLFSFYVVLALCWGAEPSAAALA